MSDLVQAPRREFPTPPVLYADRGDSWPESAEPVEEGVNLRDVLATIRRNLWLILSIATVVAGATAYVVLREAPMYRASALIRLADVRQAMTGDIGGAAMEGRLGLGSDPLLSQLEVLKGREVLGAVVDREGLRLRSATPEFSVGALNGVSITLDPEVSDSVLLRFRSDGVSMHVGTREASAGYGAPVQAGGVRLTVPSRPQVAEAHLWVVRREQAIDQLSRGLVARPREKTDAVQVEYTAGNPRQAQQVVNATIEVFQAENARAAQQQSRRRRIFLEEQLRTNDSILANAQTALSSFRSREQVYSSREKLAAQQEGLFALQVRREELAADRQIYQSLLAGLSGNRAARTRALRALASSPGVAENRVISQMYVQLMQYESARDSLTTGPSGSTSENDDVQRLNALIASTEANLVDALRSHVAVLDARIAALSSLQSTNSSEIQSLPATEAEEQRLVQQVETTRKIAEAVREELQKARMAEAVEAGQVEVVYAAPVPTTPVGTGKGVKLAMGLMLGLMVGGAAAFLREQLDRAIRHTDDVEKTLQVPGLALIPRIDSRGTGPQRLLPWKNRGGDAKGNGLVTLSDFRSSSAEAYRTLRTNLIFSQVGQSLRTIVVTSASPGEGKTTVSSNLAVTYAQQGVRVLLVDCDLRKARLHKVFNVPREPGLTHLLVGQAQPAEVLKQTGVEGLHFLSAGTLPPNPSELLGGGRMRKAMEALSSRFDLMILDSPPLLAASDAAILGAMADGVIMVVRAGQTERGAARKAMQQLQAVGARVLGAVVNDPDAKAAAYGEYYYYDYYGTKE
jgi:capsular exopolysaccharide synthesis family protein